MRLNTTSGNTCFVLPENAKMIGVMMETSKKKNHDIQPRASFWQQHYPLIVTILTLALLALYIFVVKTNTLSYGQANIIYPVYTSPNLFSMIFILVIVPIIFLSIIRMMLKKNQSGEQNVIGRGSDFLAFGLVIFIGIFACGYLFLTLFGNDTFEHKDKIIVDVQTYNLVNHIPWENFGFGRLEIYECDRLGLFCSRLSGHRFGHKNADPAELAFDAESQAISIIINGEIISTHQLGDR